MTRAWTGIGSRETPGWCAPVFAKIGARGTELELELWVTAAQIVEAAGMAPPLFVE